MMKKLLRIHQSSKTHWVGNGFPVRSVFEYTGLGRELSPFLLLDYAEPHRFPPGHERRGVGAHPHKGFETVTIAYQGELEHRDSSGGGGIIGPGDVQWMTAGNGIVHEEFHSEEFTRSGGMLQMVQLWINLRAADKSSRPGYQSLAAAQIPVVALPGEAGTARIIAGEFHGKKGSARTFTPIELWDVVLQAGKTAEFPITDGHHAMFLVMDGEASVSGQPGSDSHSALRNGDLAIFAREGSVIHVSARTRTHLLLMAGEPIDEPVVGHGPFVMNSQAEIHQAFVDFQAGRMGGLS